jgi:hypothetical protein
VVGVFVDDDVVVIPKPVVAESDVIRGDAEVEATEPDSVWASAAEMPDVAAAEAAGEASVLLVQPPLATKSYFFRGQIQESVLALSSYRNPQFTQLRVANRCRRVDH